MPSQLWLVKKNGGSELEIVEGTLPIKEVTTRGNERTERLNTFVDGKIVKTVSTTYQNNVETEKITTDVTYDGNYPIKAVTTNNKKQIITNESSYTYSNGKLVSSVDNNSDTYIFTEAYTYNGDRLATSKRITERKENGGMKSISYSEFTYNYVSDTEIKAEEVTYHKSGDPLVESPKSVTYHTYFYDGNKNLVKHIRESSYNIETFTYQYDNASQVNSANIFRLVTPDYFVSPYSQNNNLISEKSKYDFKNNNGIVEGKEELTQRFTYDYNSKNRPIKKTHYNEKNEVVEITDYTY